MGRDHVEGWTLERRLGAGAMGVVWEARARDGSPSALKLFHRHLFAHPETERRWRREWQVGERLRHPNLVQVLGDGSGGPESSPWIAMELLDGGSLRGLVERGPLPPDVVLGLARDLAEGLDALHSRGLLHLDLKPENVLLTSTGAAKIADFGAAALVESAVRSSPASVAGTYAYAAPEQRAGRTAEIDASTDLYALGAVLYEALHGVRHGGAASARRPDPTSRLAGTIDALLESDPRRRPRSAAELRRALQPGARHRMRTRDAVRGLHGREDELARLLAACAANGPAARTMTWVVGEAGVGKTRLVESLIERMRAQRPTLRVLVGGFVEDAGQDGPDALLDAWASARPDTPWRDDLAARIRFHAHAVPALAALLEGTPATASAPSAADTADAFVEYAASLAAEFGFVVVFEDVHFGGDAARTWMARLGSRLAAAGVSLVATTRPAAGGAREGADVLRLGPLPPSDIRALAADWLAGVEGAPAGLLEHVTDAAQGVPFLALEALRSLADAGALRRGADGAWRFEDRPDRLPEPDIAELLRRRISHVSREDRELLAAAACEGMHFDGAIVAGALGRDPLDVEAALRGLEADRALVRRRGTPWEFEHARVYRAVADGVDPARARTLHGALASAWAAAGAGPETRCRHLLLGPAPQEATPLLRDALLALRSRGRVGAARSLAVLALNTDGVAAGALRVEVCVLAGELSRAAGRAEEAVGRLEEAFALAQVQDLPDEGTSVALLLRTIAVERGDAQSARRWLEGARSTSRGARGPGARVRVLIQDSAEAGRRGSPSVALALAQQAVAAAETSTPSDVGLAALGQRAAMEALAGERDACVATLEAAVGCATLLGPSQRLVQLFGELGSARREAGDLAGARAALATSSDLAERIGYRKATAHLASAQATIAWREGRWDDAIEGARASRRAAEESGNGWLAAVQAQQLALAEWGAGRGAAALAHARDLARAGVQMDDAEMRGNGDEAVVFVALSLGRREEAAAALARLRSTAEGETDRVRARIVTSWEAALDGRWRAAEAWLLGARRRLRRGLSPWVLRELLAGLGAAHLGTGRVADARVALEAAIALSRRCSASDRALLARARLLACGSRAADGLVADLDADLDAAEPRLPLLERLEVRWTLWSRGGGDEHLSAAGELLAAWRDGAPVDDRTSAVWRVPLHAAIACQLGWTPDGAAIASTRGSRPSP